MPGWRRSRPLPRAYPDRPIKLVVPYAAGGGTDAIARVIAQGMTEQLGQQLVVENNGTAGGNVATAQAAKADPDGYTLLMANQGPMTVNPHLFKNVKIDPLTAFDPVTLIAEAPLVVVVPEGSRFASFQALIDEAKANPGGLTYGSAGNGSASHLATLLLANTAGLDMVHVPYKGAGPAITDLIGGRLDFMITTLPSVVGFIESGKAKPLAVTMQERVQAAARGRHDRRERLARLPGRGVVRLRGAQGHAARGRRQAARRDGGGDPDGRGAKEPRRRGCGDHRQHARGVRHLHAGRIEALGRADREDRHHHRLSATLPPREEQGEAKP